jgi:hypothetical protein
VSAGYENCWRADREISHRSAHAIAARSVTDRRSIVRAADTRRLAPPEFESS